MASFPYLSCNLTSKADGKRILDAYKILSYGDTKVAYVGISTPESITKSTPAYFQDENGNYLYSFAEDSDGTSLYKAVQTAVDSAKAEGADYVVAVGHLGEKGITDFWTGTSVIANTTGIDILIDGHSHVRALCFQPHQVVDSLDLQFGVVFNRNDALVLRNII